MTTPEVTNYSTISPDSNMTMLSLQSTIYKLPLSSTLQIRANYEQTKTKFDLLTSMWGSATATGPSNYTFDSLTVTSPTFNGEVVNTSASAAWRGEISGSDFDLHYRNLQRKNNSDSISFSSDGAATTNERFGYSKQIVGLDFNRKVTMHTRVKSAFEYSYVSRTDRKDGNMTLDKKYNLGVKNNDWDLLNVNLVYEHLDRSSDFQNWNTSNVNAVTNFRRYFDTTSSLPIDISNFGNFKKTTLTAHIDYKMKENFKVTLMGIVESLEGDDILVAGYQNVLYGASANKYMIFSGANADRETL